MSIYLKIQDAVNGRKGQVYFTIDGRRYEVPGIQKIEAHDTIKERSMNTVGTVKTQTALAGVEGSGTMTVNYYAVSTFGKMMESYRKNGQYTSFDILIVNEDKSTSLGRRSSLFSQCVLSGDVPLALLDATADDSLTIDIHFKYLEYENLEDFTSPANVGSEAI